jgi:phage terminase small subunit
MSKQPSAPAPAGLSDRSRALWCQLVPARARTPERLALLAEALRCLDLADQAREAVRRDGLTTTTARSGVVHVNPLLRVEAEARRDFARLWDMLGLRAGLADQLLRPDFGGPAAD